MALFFGPNLTDLSNSVIHRLTRVINSQSLEDARGRKCLGRINQPHDKLSHQIVALLATINHVHLQIGHHIGHHVHFHVGHHNVILTFVMLRDGDKLEIRKNDLRTDQRTFLWTHRGRARVAGSQVPRPTLGSRSGERTP